MTEIVKNGGFELEDGLKYGAFEAGKITLNENELRSRLGCRVSDLDVQDLTKRLKKVLRPRYAYRISEIERSDSGINLGFGILTSRDLEKNLRDCSRACIMAVTLGIDADRYLLRLSYTSPSEHFITDALCSAFAESLCDDVEALILGKLETSPRYSIGYGDLRLEYQRPFLDYLNADKTVGISLTGDLLMTPTKSITAIIGIKDERCQIEIKD